MAELRVSGGELRGRRFAGPKKGDDLRPTTERVREAIFSILGDVSGARVLDLFCGTGALGIEALSRGAAEAILVDAQPALARSNVERLELSERARTVRSDAISFLRGAAEGAFDLVLCDPPYGLDDRISAQLDTLIRRALAPGGRLMIETSPRKPVELELALVRERRYGDTLVRVHGAEPGEGA
jgi:16S rRNA (guanine966-N2)-methyltransferase